MVNAASLTPVLVNAAGLTPFLVKLLSEQDELTTKQALHLIDLQLREQVSFQDVHELYMLDYTTSIPSPHLRTCQLLVGLNTAARLVQILKGTAGSGTHLCKHVVSNWSEKHTQ